jgi:hypothetical protein
MKFGEVARKIGKVAQVATAFSVLAGAKVPPAHSQAPAKKIERKAEQELTERQQRILQNKLGIPYVELKQRFKVEFQIDQVDENAPTIFHLGQYHLVPNSNVDQSAVAAASQRLIYDLLRDISIEKPDFTKCIYTEGIDLDGQENLRDMREQYYYRLKENREVMKKLANLKLSESGLELKMFLDYIERRFAQAGTGIREYHLFAGDLFNIFLEIRKKHQQIILTADEEITKKLFEVYRWFGRMGELYGTPDKLAYGGAKLFYFNTGIATICLSEDPKLNEKAHIAIHKYEREREKFLGILRPLNTQILDLDKEIDGLVKIDRRLMKSEANHLSILLDQKSLLEKKASDIRKVLEYLYNETFGGNHPDIDIAREKYAVGLLPNTGDVFLKYGNGHNFTDAVTEADLSSAIKRRLIKISPRY